MTTALEELKRIFGKDAISETSMKAILTDMSDFDEILKVFPQMRDQIVGLKQSELAKLKHDSPVYRVSITIKDDSRIIFPQTPEDMRTDLEGDGSIIIERFFSEMGMVPYGHSHHRARVPHKENRVVGKTDEVEIIETRPSQDPMKSSVPTTYVLEFRAEDIEKPEVIEKLKRVNSGQFSFLTDDTLPLNDKIQLMQEYETIRLLNNASGDMGWQVDQVDDKLRLYRTQDKVKSPKEVIEKLNATLGVAIPMPRSSDDARASFETGIITNDNRQRLDGLVFGEAAQGTGKKIG